MREQGSSLARVPLGRENTGEVLLPLCSPALSLGRASSSECAVDRTEAILYPLSKELVAVVVAAGEVFLYITACTAHDDSPALCGRVERARGETSCMQVIERQAAREGRGTELPSRVETQKYDVTRPGQLVPPRRALVLTVAGRRRARRRRTGTRGVTDA